MLLHAFMAILKCLGVYAGSGDGSGAFKYTSIHGTFWGLAFGVQCPPLLTLLVIQYSVSLDDGKQYKKQKTGLSKLLHSHGPQVPPGHRPCDLLSMLHSIGGTLPSSPAALCQYSPALQGISIMWAPTKPY